MIANYLFQNLSCGLSAPLHCYCHFDMTSSKWILRVSRIWLGFITTIVSIVIADIHQGLARSACSALPRNSQQPITNNQRGNNQPPTANYQRKELNSLRLEIMSWKLDVNFVGSYELEVGS